MSDALFFAETLLKNGLGFATFFFIFELSRRAGTKAKNFSQDWFWYSDRGTHISGFRKQMPAVINGVTLVTGGVSCKWVYRHSHQCCLLLKVFAGLAYEFACRPFDIARRYIYLDKLERPESSYKILYRRLKQTGLPFFFQSSILPQPHSVTQPAVLTRMLRTIGRVGPWGVGFLVWEAYGSSGL